MNSRNRTIRICNGLAGIVAVISAVLIPLGYFTIWYNCSASCLETEAEINSRIISGIINANPQLWRFEQMRLEEVLSRRCRNGDKEIRRIVDLHSRVIAECADPLDPPLIKRTYDLKDAGLTVGRIEISRSLRPILSRAALIAFFGLLVGMIIFAVLRILPFRAVIQAERSLLEANEFLRKSEERFRSLVSATSQIVWMADGSGKKIADVPEWRAFTGQSKQETKDNEWSRAIHPEDRQRALEGWSRAVATRTPYDTEYRLHRHDGVYRYFSVRGVPIFEKDGNVREWMGACTDISERKLTEKRIETALEEKDILLKEIHHRTKNNLQIISSLLRLQSACIADGKYREMLRESLNRINAMALIHEKLYQSEDLINIDFGHYIRSLCYDLFDSHGAAIGLKLNAHNIHVDIETAIPCGLIINELVTNTLKYAFTDIGSGDNVIEIDLHENEDKLLVLTIRDNGKGMPAGLDLFNLQTLGLRLVKILTDQLHGTIDFNNDNGAEFRFTFKAFNGIPRANNQGNDA